MPQGSLAGAAGVGHVGQLGSTRGARPQAKGKFGRAPAAEEKAILADDPAVSSPRASVEGALPRLLRPSLQLWLMSIVGVAACSIALGLALKVVQVRSGWSARMAKVVEAGGPLTGVGAASRAPLTLSAGCLSFSVGPDGGDSRWASLFGGPVHEADAVSAASFPPNPGESLWYQASVPFAVRLGEQILSLRAKGRTVGEALADAGIFLFGLDYSVPPAEAPLEPGMAVTVHRVEERVEILRQSIPFETIWQPDPSLELDQTRLLRPGQEGISCWRYKLRIVDGQVQERVIQDTWVEQEPIDRLMAYGTAIVLREVQSPQGPQQYWRRMRVLVTSYSPKTAGLPRQSPHYGRTRTGKEAGTGVIAVDPSVIPLGTRIYVPGYGIGVAEDTGSMIRGRHIDVCYDDDELVSWYQWVDIYLLAPPPPPQLIRYLLPSWPKEE